ncbi:MAG: alginate O-acetyltransferase AlgF [Spirochaetota bacterium]
MKKTRRRFPLMATIVLLCLGSGVLAGQEEGLYGSGAPDDAAFVRLVNAGADGEVSTSIGGTELGPVPTGDASPYRPVAAGLYTVRAEGRTAELIAEDAAYYTVAITSDSLLVFEDPEHTDPAEAQLFLYNLSSRPALRLVATERDTDITEELAAGESTQVTVTPVAVQLGLYSEATELEALGDPGLERGESYSVFAFDRDERIGAFVKQAQVVTE